MHAHGGIYPYIQAIVEGFDGVKFDFIHILKILCCLVKIGINPWFDIELIIEHK